VENIETAVTEQLRAIPVSDFQRCYEESEQRLRRCLASEGNYFVGDKIDFVHGAAFNVTHFESRVTHLLYTAINTTEHG
jgi:hypothetical protein